MKENFPQGFELGLGDEVDVLLRSGRINYYLNEELRMERLRTLIYNPVKRNFVRDSVIKPFFSGEIVLPDHVPSEVGFLEFLESAKQRKIDELGAPHDRITTKKILDIAQVGVYDILQFANAMSDMWVKQTVKISVLSDKYELTQSRAQYWQQVVDTSQKAYEYQNNQSTQ